MVDSAETKMTENGIKKSGSAPLSIEESFEKLEAILREMEKEGTGLEQSFALYEEGMKLLKGAEESIDHVEKQIRVLSGQEQELDQEVLNNE